MDAIKQAIEALERVEYYSDGGISRYPNEAQVVAALSALRAQQDTKDGERFAWYFSDKPKGDFLNAFMQGIREHWSLDQWRAAIDAARGADRADRT
jgi:hypothetical protein